MILKYGYALEVGHIDDNNSDPVLGNLTTQMLVSTGKKRTGKAIIGKMAKAKLIKDDEM